MLRQKLDIATPSVVCVAIFAGLTLNCFLQCFADMMKGIETHARFAEGTDMVVTMSGGLAIAVQPLPCVAHPSATRVTMDVPDCHL
eukprot:2160839-Amphidinium_carterae.1